MLSNLQFDVLNRDGHKEAHIKDCSFKIFNPLVFFWWKKIHFDFDYLIGMIKNLTTQACVNATV